MQPTASAEATIVGSTSTSTWCLRLMRRSGHVELGWDVAAALADGHEETPRTRGTHVFSLLDVPSLASTPSTSRVIVASVSFRVCPKSRRSSFQTVTSVAA
jgi:hypothetical protein